MSPMLYLLLGAQDAAAAWPADKDWTPLLTGGTFLTDPEEDVTGARVDLVGDSADAAGLWDIDADNLYLRMRLNDNPCSNPGEIETCEVLLTDAWGFLFSVDGDDANFEAVLLLSNFGNSLTLRENPAGTGWDDSFSSNAAWSTNIPIGAGLARLVQADSSFLPNIDVFLDLQVPLDELASLLGDDYSDDLRIALATHRDFSVVTGDALETDVAGGDNTGTVSLSDALADALLLDADGDGLLLGEEEALGTDPEDADTDDDGVIDGDEVNIHLTDPLLCDSDKDGLSDGLELGVTVGHTDTDPGACFVADSDPKTTTDPRLPDSDGGSVWDADEDLDRDGQQDAWETDPNDPTDDVDADDDGVPDSLEEICGGDDTDDVDGDGVLDVDEGRRDSDGDGSPDFCDPDDDGDTIPTAEEGDGSVDTDGDGTPDYLDWDADNDGKDDIDEGTGDDDCDAIRNFQDADDTDGPCGEGGDTGTPGDTGADPDPDTGGQVFGFTGGSFTGGACSALPAGASLFPALAALLGVSRRRRQQQRRRGAAGLVALVLPGTAAAQEVNAQIFQPAIDSQRFTTVDDSTVGQLGIGGGLAFNYADDPFVYRYEDDREEVALLGRTTTTNVLAYGNWRRGRLGIDVPLHALSDGYRLDSAGGRVLGDMAVEAKGELLNRYTDAFGLGGSLRLTLPTGNGGAFLGDATTSAEGQINVSRTSDRVVTAANVGYRFAAQDNDQLFGDVTAGSRLLLGLGVSVDVVDALWVSGELTAQRLLGSSGADGAMPVEGLVAAHAPLGMSQLIGTLGAGGGLTSGLGAPDFRVVASVGWHPHPNKPVMPTVIDDDGDGTFEYTLTISDADGLPVAAWLQVPSRDFNAQAGPDGILRGTLPAGAHEIIITADGYLRAIRVLEGDDDQRIAQEVVLIQPRVIVGEERLEVSERIFFEVDSDIIKSDSHSLLDEVAMVLTDHPEIKLLEIQGHTDDQGPDAYNKALSQKRAEAVRRYLIDQGIPARRLRATGYGEEYPRVEGTTAEARAMNRRVEFVLLQVED